MHNLPLGNRVHSHFGHLLPGFIAFAIAFEIHRLPAFSERAFTSSRIAFQPLGIPSNARAQAGRSSDRRQKGFCPGAIGRARNHDRIAPNPRTRWRICCTYRRKMAPSRLLKLWKLASHTLCCTMSSSLIHPLQIRGENAQSPRCGRSIRLFSQTSVETFRRRSRAARFGVAEFCAL